MTEHRHELFSQVQLGPLLANISVEAEPSDNASIRALEGGHPCKKWAICSRGTSYWKGHLERIAAFDGLEILCTKVTNAFSVSGASDADIKDLKTINAKIQSPGKKKTVVSKEGTTQQGISTSQQSYDSKINFFINFIQYLETKPFYKPNEDELKVPALQSKLAEMEATNANVDAAFFNFNQSLNDRNNEMYNPTTGLVQASKDVKKYARSIFGTNSPEYHQLNSIAFQVIKK